MIKEDIFVEDKLLYLDEDVKELPHCCVKCGSEEKLKKYKKVPYSRWISFNSNHKWVFRASRPLALAFLIFCLYQIFHPNMEASPETVMTSILGYIFILLIGFDFFRPKHKLSYYICKKCLRPRKILWFLALAFFGLGCYLLYEFFSVFFSLRSQFWLAVYTNRQSHLVVLGGGLISLGIMLQLVFYDYIYNPLRMVAKTKHQEIVLKGCGKEVLEEFKENNLWKN